MTKCRYMISYSLYSHHLGWIIWFINLPPISGLCFLLLVSYPPGFVSSRVFVSPWFRILPVWFLSCWFLFFTRRLSGLFLRPRDFPGFVSFPVLYPSWFRILPGFVSFPVLYPSWFH